ncbi:MAG: hypothetical protein NVS1B12_00090 [Acidimicrobiales bacterium]
MVLAIVLPGCGTHLPDSAFRSGAGSAGAAAGTGGLAAGTDGGSLDGGTAGTGAAGGTSATPEGSAAGPTAGTGSAAGGGPAGAGTSGPAGGGAGAANAASDVGVTPTSIRIGNVTGASGALGPDAFGVTLNGLRIWVASINARGGINGRKVDLQTCDDGQDGSQNIACTQQLVGQKKVFALIANNSLSSSGSAHYEFTQGVPDLGFPLNNGYYKYPNMFSIEGTPYPRDGKQVGFNGNTYGPTGIYRWFKQQRHVDRAAFFFYSVAASSNQGHIQEQAAAAEGIKKVYDPNGGAGENIAAPNFDSDVLAMKGEGASAPQAIFDAIDVNGNQKLCASMDRYKFDVVAKVSTIEVWNQDLGTSAWSPHCRNEVYVAGTSVSYAESSNPIVAAYLNDYKTYGAGGLQAQWTLEGYATGVMFADGVAQMGANVTRKGFMAWLNGLRDYTDHGYFSPRDYVVRPPNQTVHDCVTIAQWQDAAGGFVTRAPLSNCIESAQVGGPASQDNS